MMAVSLQEKSLELDENSKIQEWLRCSLSPEYFLRNHCFLQDRAKKATIRFEPWPHLIDLIHLFLEEKLIIILKARQLGISYLVAGYCLWMAKFNENVKVLFLSQGEEEAFDLLAKCIFIDNHLPDYLKTTRYPDQKGVIGFPDSGGEMKALPSTEKAGRSTDASIVVCDEWEFHPYAEQNFAALKPTIDAVGAQFIGLSTADKTKLIEKSFFKQKYKGAMAGDSNFKHRFLSWELRPGRTQEWFADTVRDLRPWQIEQEYPSSEDQALATLGSIRFFDADAVDRLYRDVDEPMDIDVFKKWPSVRIYKLPVVGNKYCLFTDPSDGKEDPHATIVIDGVTFEQVAESHGKVPADEAADIHDALVRFYNNAFNDFEKNAFAGGKFQETIENLGTPNRHYQNKKNKEGWWTGKPQRKLMIWGLEEAIRHNLIRVHSKECIVEFGQFMKPEGEEPQAPTGGHDDYIFAWGGVWQIRKDMPVGESRIISMKYREGETGGSLWPRRLMR